MRNTSEERSTGNLCTHLMLNKSFHKLLPFMSKGANK